MIAAQLDEARGSGAQHDTVLPVFINRKTSWDERKLRAASSELSANRDFAKLRAVGPVSAEAMVEPWRKALDSVARLSYGTHCFDSRRSDSHSIPYMLF